MTEVIEHSDRSPDISTQPNAPTWDPAKQAFQVRVSTWDGSGKGDGGVDLFNHVVVEIADDGKRVYMSDDVCGSDTFLTPAEARQLARALWSMASRLENVSAPWGNAFDVGYETGYANGGRDAGDKR